MGIINYNAKEILLEKIKEFRISKDELAKRSQMRNDFVSIFTPEKIKKITPNGYFPGADKENDCIGYQLEWGTILLGSIKGGSIAKYGPKEQFDGIKKLLIKLTSFSDDHSEFYKSNGNLSEASITLIADSLEIKGMKSGRTVLGKLLSIYYPDTFIPFFNDQDYLLGKIVKDNSNDSTGLESYIKNNYLFLEIKKELSSEPAFIKNVPDNNITNDFLYKFLYHCFPHDTKAKETDDKIVAKTEEEERIEALETDHYQKLIHRNFARLFKSYRYYDESQNSNEGHYATEDVGIMDFLCLDERDNFVVIELKRKGTDETLAQICRYMGWVKENLAKENQTVLGIIVSESKDIRLEYAIKVVPNITLKQMKLNVSIDSWVDN